MSKLPDNVTAYKRTPTFDESTLPGALRNDHATKAGVWGLIHVESGRLSYQISDTGAAIELAAGDMTGVIEPQVRHRVTPVGHVRFYVEFYR